MVLKTCFCTLKIYISEEGYLIYVVEIVHYAYHIHYGLPEGTKLMTSRSAKSSRTFRMLFTLIHEVKASS